MVGRIIIRNREILQDCEDEDMGMQVLVNLSFSDADSSEGNGHFLVQAIVTNKQHSTKLEFELPPITEIQDSYNSWQDNYYKLILQPKGFKKGKKNIPSSREECYKYVDILRNQLNQWLLPVKSELEKVDFIQPNSEIYFFINNQKIVSEKITEILHKIPWQEWDYFTDCDALEAVLYLHETESNTSSVVQSVVDSGIFRRVRITSIFGDVENIKEGVERDKEEIEKLEKRGAEVIHLEQPQRRDLKKLWDEPCDILFYSGHSNSEVNSTAGRFKINENENLSLEEIRNTFREAIKKGLKIAIFNSCDGLGLACELAKLGLPYIIVWRESVPVEIAQKFIEYFLCSYSRGKSLFDSVRDARIKLKELTNKADSNKQIPGLNWLPIICVSTKDEPPLWEDLGGLTGKLPDSPYQGLSAFGEEDAPYFFGRDKFVGELLEAVNTKSLVPIIGASGSGKSSVVFAGLLPRLREIGMQIVSFRPGSNPFDSLAVALKQQTLPVRSHSLTREGLGRLEELELEVNLENDEQALCRFIENLKNLTSQRFILIIDQFEELYTLTPEAQQQTFLDTLLYAVKHAPNFCLVFTLRADFYGHAISHPTFSNNLDNNSHNCSPMSSEELRAVIEQPAAKLKVELEQGLAKKLIDDLGNQPGRLPLLEFTLSLLWEKHDKWYLTHKAYEEIGGLEKALAKYADGVLNPLSVVEKEKAERIFIQLISPGEGTEDTKRKATRGEVGEENWGLVEFLANQRLVVTGWDESSQQETVEIVHEALIREWGMLREWIKSNRRFRIWQERLKPDVREWENKRDNPNILLQGTRLAIAFDWLEQRREELSSQEQGFIRASVEYRNKERNKQKRRRQLTLSGLIGGLMLVSTFAGISEIRRTDAEAGKISTVAKNFFTENDHEVALAEAIKAGKLISKSIWKPWVASETKMKVVSTLREAVYGYQIKALKHEGISSISYSPDGKTIASASHDGTLKLWNTTTGKESKTFKLTSNPIHSIAFFPDGTKIITASNYDGMVKFWDITTGKKIKTYKFKDLEFHQSDSIRLSSDGKIITYLSFDGTVRQWDSDTGKQITKFKASSGIDTINSFVFSDAKTIRLMLFGLSGKNNSPYRFQLWDTTTGKEIKTLEKYYNKRSLYPYPVGLSPNSKIIVLALLGGRVKLLDLNTGKETKTFRTASVPHELTFSADSKTIALVSMGIVQLLDSETGKEIKKFNINTSSLLRGIKFSPNGKAIAFYSRDTAYLLNINTGVGVKTLKGHSQGVTNLSFSPNGKNIASASYDGTLKLWDRINVREIQNLKVYEAINDSFSSNTKSSINITGEEIKRHANHKIYSKIVYSVIFSRSGKTIVSASNYGVNFWDSRTGKMKTFKRYPQGFLKFSTTVPPQAPHVRFSPNNKTIASASDDGIIRLWDIGTSRVKIFKGHSKGVNSISFSPDGKTIASASNDKTVKLWDINTGREIKTFKEHNREVNSVSFSPGGKTIASASNDKTVKLWNINTGKEIKTFKGNDREVTSINFSPDGKIIASALAKLSPPTNNKFKLWDVSTGREITTLQVSKSFISNISFSPDGKAIASISNDGQIILWNFDLESLLNKGCELIGNYLEHNPDISKSDKQVCNGINDQKR